MASTSSDRDGLPNTVVPYHYDLSIYNMELGGDWGYEGKVAISARILEPCHEIVLNAHELNIAHAIVDGTEAHEISYDAALQRATLHFKGALPKSEKATITLTYRGCINSNMVGFYKSRYKPIVPAAPSVPRDESWHYQLSTQFESCDARRAFPCFDEPALKATFVLSIELPDDQVALSNMPVDKVSRSREGWQTVSFQQTPKMSSYLLVWAIGDFEYIEAFTERKYNGKSLPFRIYTTRGSKNQGQYALDHGTDIIDYYSNLFGMEYPLPKIDCLAVHEFSHNAMENWGLVLYRAASLLSDEGTSDAKKQMIVYVLGHELAHQWFGNLVTMVWWSELWLNEGFATWVGWLSVDHVHPEWNIWEQYTYEAADKALQLDSLRSSHPIEVPLRNALEVEQIFDAISYYKGSLVIRMLAEYLGVETFLKGVSIYLNRHAYSNATTNDLWAAVSEASGQDIKALISDWTLKIGYPMISVSEEAGQINIKQSRFLSTGDVQSEDDQTTWWIPLAFKERSDNVKAALTLKTENLGRIDNDFYKIKNDNAGCFRVNYPPSRLMKLAQQKDRLSGSDRIGLVSDASALSSSGDAATPDLLSFLETFTQETSFYVWQAIMTAIEKVQSIFAPDAAITSGLKAFVLKLITTMVDKLGWEAKAHETFTTTQLRSLLLQTAGKNGHKDVIAEVQRRFKQHATKQHDSTPIPSNLRTAIYSVAVQHGGQEEYDALLSEWSSGTSVDGREVIYRSLGSLRVPELIKTYIDFLFTSAATADLHFGGLALGENPTARLALWHYLRDNFDAVLERHGSNLMIIDRLLLASLRHFSDRDVEKDITAFFRPRDNKGYNRTIHIVEDTILGRARYRERDSAVLEQWLRARNYV